ncbi:MAG: hypothetical protein DPW18_11445 [Chloroflexi bacterium]|nr:hypothetical protein [Chloroflexota bacterium]MDL1944295.1 hypothetical protein [Chloroflexi bacterium CFX2]
MNILLNLYVILVLRIAHIAGGVLWVGSAILYLLVLIPAVRSSESAGQKFMQNFGPRFGKMMGLVTTVTVLSGALLYARFFSGGISFIWTTGAGAAFTVGALAALASYVIGSTVFGKTQEKIGALGAAMAGAGGPPKPEQVSEMNRLQSFLMKAYQFDLVLLVVAMVAMAVARYL